MEAAAIPCGSSAESSLARREVLRYNEGRNALLRRALSVRSDDNMRLERLPCFIDLYETRSYTKAAQKNFLSQTSVTQFVNGLEEEFGVKLFDRSTLPIQPTAAGRQLYHDAKLLWRQYQRLKAVLPRLEKEEAAPIRLCYTSQIDLKILLPFVRQFKAFHPEVAFEVELCSFRDASQLLWAGKCDGAIGIDFEPEYTEGMDQLALV